ncbi:MAG TPA: type IV pilus biogenesis/stability protein PilW [Xanthomonadaceae bacterium]|nr:type IV pilus biogenesis/stability protein PilW [Xanthomonadaceae bacterium]
MRPEAARSGVLLLAALVVGAGCASGGGTRADREATSPVAQRAINMAKVHLDRGEPTRALGEAESAVASDPHSALARVVLGTALEALDRRDEAGRAFHRAAELAPANGTVLNAHGAFLCRNGETDAAMAAFLKATADPAYREPEQALANAGSCAADAGRKDVAELNFRAALTLEPRLPQALVGMAKLEHQRGDALGARAFLQRREALGALGAGELALAIEIETAAGDTRAAARYRSALATMAEQAGATRPADPGSRMQ